MSDYVNVVDFIKSLDSMSKVDLISHINKYFSNRIFKKIPCSKRELKALDMFVRNVKKSEIFNKNERKNILKTIEKLYILTKESKKFDIYVKLNEKNVNEFNEEEILTYLNILIKNCKCCVSLSTLKIFIKRYLKITNDVSRLYELILDNDINFSKSEKHEINIFILDNTLNIILEKIIKELENDKISLEQINDYFNQLAEIKIKMISHRSIRLFNDILNKFNNSDLVEKLGEINFAKLKNQINDIFNNIIEIDKDKKIEYDIISGKIQLTNNFCNNKFNMDFGVLANVYNERIITIDESFSPDLDGAFSIRKIDDIFVLKVYISDVPTFLMKNRKLCEEAYLRGTSMYVRYYNKDNSNYNIDMLPPILSHKYLSLHSGYPKNVIAFTFKISENGEIYSSSVDRKRIVITDKLTPDDAQDLINSKEYKGLLQDDLRNYKKLCDVISQKSNDKFLKVLDSNSMGDLVGLTSILVNYYIGHEAEFSIYRNKGMYTKDNFGYYTHSSTPLRRFVSNINLAFFLEQNGVVNFPNKDLYCVEDNVDEIINHLNEREEISKFVDRNSHFVKKYINK